MANLNFRHVYKRYDNNPYTIRDVNIDIADGEFCVFVGPSGCGKSTILRMVAGLEDVSEGEILIGGKVVNATPPAKRGVAMVFQSYALYPHMTVYQNIAFGLKTLGGNSQDVDVKVRQAAETLGLTPLLNRLPKELSGGQRQRVAIGRAIVRQPQVFLFDEPLSNLDAALRVQTRLEIAKLHKQIGTTSLFYVTHDQVEAMTLASRIVLLRAGPDVQTHGSVAQYGPPLELYHRPNSLFVAGFIGSPKMNFFPGHLVSFDEKTARVRIGKTELSAKVKVEGLAPGAPVTLGIRPEHLTLGAVGAAQTLSAKTVYIERLGEADYVYCESAEAPLINLRVDNGKAPKIDDTVGLLVEPESTHLFDETGKACRRTVDLPA